MKDIKLFENFDEIDLDVYYELWTLDRNGEEEEFISGDGDDDNYNPYDLNEMVILLMNHEKYNKDLFIKKITKENIDKEIIDRIKMQLKVNKYNI